MNENKRQVSLTFIRSCNRIKCYRFLAQITSANSQTLALHSGNAGVMSAEMPSKHSRMPKMSDIASEFRSGALSDSFWSVASEGMKLGTVNQA